MELTESDLTGCGKEGVLNSVGRGFTVLASHLYLL